MPKKDRNRIGIDVDPEIESYIRRLAKQLKVPISQIWNFLAFRGAIDIENEDSDIWDRLEESDSKYYKFNIRWDDLKRKLRGDDDDY